MKVSSDTGSPFVSGGGGTSVQYVYDGVSVVAVDGVNRKLKDVNGNTIVDFANKTNSKFDGSVLKLWASNGVANNSFSVNAAFEMTLSTSKLVADAYRQTGNVFTLQSAGLYITDNAFYIHWSDVGISRISAGILTIDNGSSGRGSIRVLNLIVEGNWIFLSTNDAPPTQPAGSNTSVYGSPSNNTILGEPDRWIPASDGTDAYRIPAYKR
jgi:hypothetical protein